MVVGVCDGFVGNRILARYREAADTLLMDGSTPWEIDEAMVEFGYAMEPYTAQDLSGLDIAHANRRRQDATRNPARRYMPIADRMIELGKLGRKTCAGWYRYPGGGGRVEDPIVADLVTVFGYGFPRWRGGLMHYADTLGPKSIVAQLERLGEEDPVAWKISPLLHRCAATGTRIADAAPYTCHTE